MGFSANGSMTQTDDGPTVDVTVTVEIGDHPNITIDISHETKGYLNFKTTTNLSTGKYSINAISYATTADDGHFTASVGCTTSLERLGEFEIRVRSLNKIIDEDNRDMAYEAGVFWKEFNVENKVIIINNLKSTTVNSLIQSSADVWAFELRDNSGSSRRLDGENVN